MFPLEAQLVSAAFAAYPLAIMPRLWTDTIDAHRQAVREAIMTSAVALVKERGLGAVTMSQIADTAGIGRATLYKYFPRVEAILSAWHQRHVSEHLERLGAIGSGGGEPLDRLEAVLEAYATIAHQRGAAGAELSSLLHRDDVVAQAQRRLLDIIRGLLVELAAIGGIRGDVAPDELASYCLHALGAASALPRQGLDRLVAVTMTGLQPELHGRG